MKTLIIGGGLSGLALANLLQAKREDYLLIEARARFGGRIKTEHHGGGYFDMGPAWFWPAQPRIAALIDDLGLEKFDQYAQGDLVFEDERGQVQRGRGFSSMQGSWRLKGGLGALIKSLADRVPEDCKRLNTVATHVTREGSGVSVTCANGDVLHADRVVLSLPLRIAADLTFQPALPMNTLHASQATPTWMAGHAKAVAVYDTPFWRDKGLSGDAQSRFGPMVEIHDASPHNGGPYALFGFIGVPPNARSDEQMLRRHLNAQLVRLFGDEAADPLQLFVKDWAFDRFTATQADEAPLYAHPTYVSPPPLDADWHGALYFSGTEVAPEFGGYLEGALEAAQNVLNSFGIESR